MNGSLGTAEETLDYIEELYREQSVLNARMVRALAYFHGLRREFENGKYASDEIAALLSLSTMTAANQMYTAVQLVERLPDTVAAMESGVVDLPKARAILDVTEPLTVAQAREVAADVHDWSVGRPVGAVRRKLAREVIKVDPDGAHARKEAKTKNRRVEFFPGEDGMATLWVYDTAERLRGLYNLLDHAARQAKAAGSPGTLDTLRADALSTVLEDRVQVELRVTVPASVLAGVSNEPGWLHGYGPITSQTVWELAQRSQFWRRIVTDPLTGQVVEVSRRNPTTGLREYIDARTPTCVGVGCSRPAESCETDHTTDYTKGGATADHNLGPACRRHNLIKLDGGWKLEQPTPGQFIWTTPAGRRHPVLPEAT